MDKQLKVSGESWQLWRTPIIGFIGILLINVLLLLFYTEASAVYNVFSHYSLLWGVAAIIVFTTYKMRAAKYKYFSLFVLFCCLLDCFISPYFLVSGFRPFVDLASSAEMVVLWGLVPAGLGWMFGYVNIFER